MPCLACLSSHVCSIQTYEPNWQSLAENLAMTYTSTAYDPTAALVSGS